MFINSLKLSNYRNYETADIIFDHGINILFGDNAQGKTNILEAIYTAATTKSHRGAKDREMIRLGQDEAHIRMEVEKNSLSTRIDMHLRKTGGKGVAIDGVPISRAAELFGNVNVILFSPEDLKVIKEGPSERRRFTDTSLCQMSRVYYSYLGKYNKILNQRNNLLRDIYYDERLIDTLDVWDDQLCEYGEKIISERKAFTGMINAVIRDIHNDISGSREDIEIIYEPSVNEHSLRDVIREKRNIDIKSGMTQAGPHRDDISIMINGIDVRRFGSQGQQRTAALSLKLSEIEIIRKVRNDKPVLLLDDVMSELDSTRREALMDKISDIQSVITCTGYDDFVEKRINIDRLFNVSAGNIREIKEAGGRDGRTV